MYSTEIRPVTDLAKNLAKIESICLEQDTPVYITKNGANHLVIMSHDYFERLKQQLALYERLLAAECELRRGELIEAGQLVTEIETEILGDQANDSTDQKLSG